MSERGDFAMTVADLVALLSAAPPDAEVLIDHEHGWAQPAAGVVVRHDGAVVVAHETWNYPGEVLKPLDGRESREAGA